MRTNEPTKKKGEQKEEIRKIYLSNIFFEDIHGRNVITDSHTIIG